MGKHRTIGGILSVVTERFRFALAQTGSQRTICWGTLKEAQRLGCAVAATRPWAYAWIRRHMETLPLSQITVLDAGAGLSNPLLDWYRPRVRKAYLIDLLTETREEGNTTILRADLEKDVPLPDASVDFVSMQGFCQSY